MDLEKERVKRDDLIHKAEEITAVAEGESREVTKEEHRAFEDLMAQSAQIDQRIEREERIINAKAKAERSHQTPTKPDLGKEYAQYGQPVKFRSFGEQMQSVARKALDPHYDDPRLEVRVPMGMGEGLGSDGGFLVQTDFSTELLRQAYETGQVASRCKKISLSSNANSIKIAAVDETSRIDGSRWGGVASAWTAEAGTKTPSMPQLREINLVLHKLTAAAYATDELLADASALESLLMTAFAEEIAFRLDNAIIRGSGAGQPLGILASPALVTVAAEGGQPIDTVVTENLVNMYSRLHAGNRRSAVWFINQNVEPQLMQMSLAVGAGGTLTYMPPGGLSQQPYATLFGLPVIPIEQASSIGDVGDVILADMSQYLLVDKGGMQAASSIHVRFLNDESTFRFVYRVAGEPTWSAPKTPFLGGANFTTSPFVTLAAR